MYFWKSQSLAVPKTSFVIRLGGFWRQNGWKGGVNLSHWADRQANGLFAHPRSNVINWLVIWIKAYRLVVFIRTKKSTKQAKENLKISKFAKSDFFVIFILTWFVLYSTFVETFARLYLKLTKLRVFYRSVAVVFIKKFQLLIGLIGVKIS